MALVTELGAVIDRSPCLSPNIWPPTFTTILAEHLARSSHRPAREAIDGEIVKAGQIYLAPGGRHMRVARHGTDVVDRPRRWAAGQFLQTRRRPVVYLRDRCLAGRRSRRRADRHGLGRNARRKEIVAAGGNVIAQDEASSVVWGMPAQRECRHLRRHSAAQSDRVEVGSGVFGESFVTPLDYEFLRKLLKERSGLDLSSDKQYLVESRLIPLARRVGLAGIAETRCENEDWVRGADGGGGRGNDHQRNLLFSGQIPFDHLREAVTARADAGARANRRSLRIWCAASSTGQEPYSIRDVPEGICFGAGGVAGLKIVATDLSQAVLEKSRAGIFSQFEVQRGLPIQMLVKQFTQIGELWQLNADIRAMVQHRQLNLLQDFSHLGTFDVIFCRNVPDLFRSGDQGRHLRSPCQDDRARWRPGAGAAESVVEYPMPSSPIRSGAGFTVRTRSGRPAQASSR